MNVLCGGKKSSRFFSATIQYALLEHFLESLLLTFHLKFFLFTYNDFFLLWGKHLMNLATRATK
jgi:hypothetical protein